MNDYTSSQPPNQGNTKLSEIGIDRAPKLFTTAAPQTSALISEEVAFDALTELARRQSYILRSIGNMNWSGTQLRFDDSAEANTIIFDVLSSEGVVNASFSLVLNGSTTANTPTTFEFINLTDGALLYMELNSALITDMGSSFVLGNDAGGGSTVVGMRLRLTTVAAGMPQNVQNPTGGTLFNIPLACVHLNPFLGTNDIFWIPHGIRWPAGTVSNLGAVIIQGPQPWADHFASSQATLTSAIASCSAAGGGIILITAPFSVSGTNTIPANTKLLGRGLGVNQLTMLAGSQLQLGGTFATMQDVTCIAASGFTGTMVAFTANNCSMTECYFDISATTDVATNIAVNLDQSNSRMYHCGVHLGSPSVNQIGINYQSGATGPNTDVDTIFY